MTELQGEATSGDSRLADLVARVGKDQEKERSLVETRALTLEFARVTANLLLANNIVQRDFNYTIHKPQFGTKRRFGVKRDVKKGTQYMEGLITSGWRLDKSTVSLTDEETRYRTLLLEGSGALVSVDIRVTEDAFYGYQPRSLREFSANPDATPLPVDDYPGDNRPLFGMLQIDREHDVRLKLVDLVAGLDVDMSEYPEEP